MSKKNTAIKVENISKCYRVGQKSNVHDTFGKTVFEFIKSPLNNYRKYRSLYRFDDTKSDNSPSSNSEQSDILWAVRDVSFEVKVGEVVGIIGVNGAGKSTLLKVLTRITPPTNGRIEILGKVSSLLEVGTGFHPELTGRENVYLNGTILGMRKKEIDRKFDEIVDFSGVERFLDTPVKRYSSGMKVRLAFAVAAHLEPEILIIDEVLAVGDAEFQKKCLGKMKDVSKHGRTVIFVSHNMQAVTRLCSRTILLNGGRVLADGPSHEIVSVYMQSEKTAKAERKWIEMTKAPGDEVVRLCSIRVRTKEGQVSEVMEIRKPVGVEIEYEVLLPGHRHLVYFHLINDEGLEIFESFENDVSLRMKTLQPGRYVSTAWIPGDFLAEGIFFITPCIRTLDPEQRRLRVDDAIAFHAVDSRDGDSASFHYAGHINGVVMPLLKWETQFCSDVS